MQALIINAEGAPAMIEFTGFNIHQSGMFIKFLQIKYVQDQVADITLPITRVVMVMENLKPLPQKPQAAPQAAPAKPPVQVIPKLG